MGTGADLLESIDAALRAGAMPAREDREALSALVAERRERRERAAEQRRLATGIERRDAKIAEAAHALFGHLSERGRAARLADAFAGYFPHWLASRGDDAVNPHRPGTLRWYLWSALDFHPHPPSAERVRKILGRACFDDPPPRVPVERD